MGNFYNWLLGEANLFDMPVDKDPASIVVIFIAKYDSTLHQGLYAPDKQQLHPSTRKNQSND